MPQIPYKAGVEFAKLPTHTPIPCVVLESNFMTEPNPFAGEGEPADRDVVKIVLETLDPQWQKARIWANFTASIHERSKLRPFIQACHPADLSLEELKNFDTDKLVGKQVMVVGEYDTQRDPESRWLRPKTFLRVAPAGTKARKEVAVSPAADLDF